MKMTNTWILVANSSEAKIFSVNKIKFINGKEKLSLIKEFDHPDSRKKDTEIASDKLGHYQTGGLGHGSFVEATDPQKHEADNFAREVIEALEVSRVANQFRDLILVVPPHFHGLLNKHLHKPLQKLIISVIEKDYTKSPQNVLEVHLLKQF